MKEYAVIISSDSKENPKGWFESQGKILGKNSKMSTTKIVHNKKFFNNKYFIFNLVNYKCVDKMECPQNFHVDIPKCPKCPHFFKWIFNNKYGICSNKNYKIK